MHVDDEQLQRLVDAELAEPEDDSIREHLTECGLCRERVAMAKTEQEEILALLGTLDHPYHVPNHLTLMARARRSDSRWMAKAAGFLVVAALAGAAYAAPGSPLPSLAAKILGRTQSAPVSPVVMAASSEAAVSGITVATGNRLIVEFISYQAAGTLRVRLSDDPELAVRANGAGASFSSGDQILTVANGGSTANYSITIPRHSPLVEIRLAGNRVLLKGGDRIGSDYSVSSDGAYHIPMSANK